MKAPLFISPSTPNDSLIVWDTSSSLLTLPIMLVATSIFLPIILLYTRWFYYMLRGPVTTAKLWYFTRLPCCASLLVLANIRGDGRGR